MAKSTDSMFLMGILTVNHKGKQIIRMPVIQPIQRAKNSKNTSFVRVDLRDKLSNLIKPIELEFVYEDKINAQLGTQKKNQIQIIVN